MNLTKYNNTLYALEMRSLRYRNKDQNKIDMDEVLYNEAIDKTGVVTTENLSDSDVDSEGNTQTETQVTILEVEKISGVADKLLEVHGMSPGKKVEGISRLIYENVDGLHTTIPNNDKLEKGKEIIDDLEAYIIAYSEHKMTMWHKLHQHEMSQIFNGRESELISVADNNVHKKGAGRIQQRGTIMLLFGSLIDQYHFEASGNDATWADGFTWYSEATTSSKRGWYADTTPARALRKPQGPATNTT